MVHAELWKVNFDSYIGLPSKFKCFYLRRVYVISGTLIFTLITEVAEDDIERRLYLQQMKLFSCELS
jgi:hypothetical protein